MKRTNFSKLITLTGLILTIISCDYIDDPLTNGTTPPPPDDTTVIRKALIEDFTGHRCNNCPKASEAIKAIQNNLPGRSVAVAIHAGPSNFTAPDTPSYPTDFRTPEGESLRSFFRIDQFGLPIGMVSRQGFASQGIGHLKLFGAWAGIVAQINEVEPLFRLKLEGNYNSNNRLVDLTVTTDVLLSTSAPISLNVWLCESGIVAPQKMPDNSLNVNYVHNNVFRTSLNGAAGEPITANGGNAGDSFVKNYTLNVSSNWQANNIKLVAFVFNTQTQEVLQAEEIDLNSL